METGCLFPCQRELAVAEAGGETPGVFVPARGELAIVLTLAEREPVESDCSLAAVCFRGCCESPGHCAFTWCSEACVVATWNGAMEPWQLLLAKDITQ